MNMQFLLRSHYGRTLCILLAMTTATGPSAAVWAQTPAPAGSPAELGQALIAPAAGDKIDVTYVAPDAVVIVALRPAQVMAAPAARFFPIEVASAAGLKYLGFDPAEISEAVAFVKQPMGPEPPEFGLAIKFIKPFDPTRIPAELRQHTQRGELAGRAYLQSQAPMLPSLYAPDGQTLIVAPDATLRQLVTTKDQPKAGPLIDRVRNAPGGNDLYAAVDIATLRPLIAAGLAAAQAQAPADLPPEAAQFFAAPNLISAVELNVNLSGAGPSALVVQANDDASSEQLARMVDDGLKLYQTLMTAQLAQQAASDDPVEQAMARYMQRVSGEWTNVMRPERTGPVLTFFRTDPAASGQQQMTQVAIAGILVALLLPAVQAAREAARRNQSMNQLKQLMHALLNYESAQKRFPAHARYDANGKPLLSWRVQILPYIEEQALYERFRLDEPWDSEHNRQLIPLMPAAFANPNMPFPPAVGLTNYLAVVGEPCAMNGTAEGLRFAQFTDGTAQTMVLVEADVDQAVEWTKPADWEFDANNPQRGLGGLRPGGWNAAFADGHVTFISKSIDPQVLKALFTRNGREVVNQW